MRTSLRHLGLCLGAALGLSAAAQYPYYVTITGQVSPCTPAIAGGMVHVTSSSNTVPFYDMDVPMDQD